MKVALSALVVAAFVASTSASANELSRAEQAKWDRWCQQAYDNGKQNTMKFRNHCEIVYVAVDTPDEDLVRVAEVSDE